MKRHLQWAECCTCHAKWHLTLLYVTLLYFTLLCWALLYLTLLYLTLLYLTLPYLTLLYLTLLYLTLLYLAGSRVIWIYSHKERKTHFTWKNARNLGGWYSTHFSRKTHESAGVGHPWHINLQSRWSPGAFYMKKHNALSDVGGSHMLIFSRSEGRAHFTWKNTTICPESAGVTCKFTVEIKPKRILHQKTQRFLRGWSRTEEGVYINKEQRWSRVVSSRVGSPYLFSTKTSVAGTLPDSVCFLK